MGHQCTQAVCVCVCVVCVCVGGGGVDGWVCVGGWWEGERVCSKTNRFWKREVLTKSLENGT